MTRVHAKHEPVTDAHSLEAFRAFAKQELPKSRRWRLSYCKEDSIPRRGAVGWRTDPVPQASFLVRCANARKEIP